MIKLIHTYDLIHKTTDQSNINKKVWAIQAT